MTGKVTAAELMAKLNADPEFVARRARAEEDRRRLASDLRQAQEPLLESLRGVGVRVDSVWELVNTQSSYVDALPVLVEHLARHYPASVREGIARALAVPQSKFAWSRLTQLYATENEERVRDGIAVALAAVADDDVIGELQMLVRDTRYGPSRVLLLCALERSASPQARATLIGLRDDPELKKEVEAIVRRLKRAAK